MKSININLGIDATTGVTSISPSFSNRTEKIMLEELMNILQNYSQKRKLVVAFDEFQEVADDIAMHVAAAAPRWVATEAVPADALEKERDLIARQVANEGKPDNIIPKIVDGKIAER